MNECLMTPQHEKQIGYWVSKKGKCMKYMIIYVMVIEIFHKIINWYMKDAKLLIVSVI